MDALSANPAACSVTCWISESICLGELAPLRAFCKESSPSRTPLIEEIAWDRGGADDCPDAMQWVGGHRARQQTRSRKQNYPVSRFAPPSPPRFWRSAAKGLVAAPLACPFVLAEDCALFSTTCPVRVPSIFIVLYPQRFRLRGNANNHSIDAEIKLRLEVKQIFAKTGEKTSGKPRI